MNLRYIRNSVRIVHEKISIEELKKMSEKIFGDLLRPSQGNRSRSVDDLKVRKKIRNIVTRLVTK